MMKLTQRIDEDLKTAMKARDAALVSLLRGVKSALKNAAIEKGGASAELDDAEALQVIRKQAKQREDSIQSYRAGGREDLVEREAAELVMLEAFLPRQLSADEVKALVSEAIAEAGATSRVQMGAVMKLAQQKAAGRVDGKTLSQAVQVQLS